MVLLLFFVYVRDYVLQLVSWLNYGIIIGSAVLKSIFNSILTRLYFCIRISHQTYWRWKKKDRLHWRICHEPFQLAFQLFRLQ